MRVMPQLACNRTGSTLIARSYMRKAAKYLGDDGSASVLRRYRCPPCFPICDPQLMNWALRHISASVHSLKSCRIYNQACERCRRHTSADAELYKDIEGVLEGYCHTLVLLPQQTAGGCAAGSAADEEMPRQDMQEVIAGLLELWDGVCCLFAHTAKPSAWLGVLLKTLKAVPAEARAQAAYLAKV